MPKPAVAIIRIACFLGNALAVPWITIRASPSSTGRRTSPALTAYFTTVLASCPSSFNLPPLTCTISQAVKDLPHWPHTGEPDPPPVLLLVVVVAAVVAGLVVVIMVVVVVGVEPPRADWIWLRSTGEMREAMMASPAALG